MQVLTKDEPMFLTRKNIPALLVMVGLIALDAAKTDIAASQTANPTSQIANSSPSDPVPAPGYVAAGTTEAMKLLRLMDSDNSGKVSRAEFMAFMNAEFDHLDINHDGKLDLKELKNSQLMILHRGGTRR